MARPNKRDLLDWECSTAPGVAVWMDANIRVRNRGGKVDELFPNGDIAIAFMVKCEAPSACCWSLRQTAAAVGDCLCRGASGELPERAARWHHNSSFRSRRFR